MNDLLTDKLRVPGFAGEDPNVFDDPKRANRVVALVVGADGKPLAGMTGGGSGSTNGGGSTSSVLPPQSLAVSAAPASLTVPARANAASVHVISGSVRWSLGGVPSASTPLLSVGDSADLTGAELAAFRMVREGATDAQVYVTYGVVG